MVVVVVDGAVVGGAVDGVVVVLPPGMAVAVTVPCIYEWKRQ
jgi:hypothetical protein